MKCIQTIPIFRIFDYNKAIEFYVGWLGFTIDWEHQFDKHAPIYMQVSFSGMSLHLSEHHGDGTPGTHIHVNCTGIKAYHKALLDKQYKYNKPGLEKTGYNTWCVEVNDPFNNKIFFNEEI
ncbi:glyoxalase superfamily protein [Sphingobacterium sp. SG20118]|uniref:glyoxalase superfamily protein n=1 Tax=Sphingobacterium TaxID=28453 RepID=UPI0004F68D5E|nr:MULTISPECIES: glyoxalase/bleomycin resistance/extradiol dioxygenase family protein [Sphingobacterium]AIM38781.1 bleomycin resistance protein [Sphingobacterium sp. ML3W]MDH5825243.1 glyoxalase/bleomycin resistance/extradiol dioxygenase family protein [Sphingobacterium faecium]